MKHGIAGYTARKENSGIRLERSYAGVVDSCFTNSFDEVAEWITQEYPNTLHVVWLLSDFADVVLSLIPKDKREELSNKTRVVVDDTKIFYIDRWLGFTRTAHLHGNFYRQEETNLFGIQHWMPDRTDEPANAIEVERYGQEIESGLEMMQIEHDKLTSPVGVYGEELRQYNLPTTFSNNEIIDASMYCEMMMRREWRSAYKVGYFDKVNSLDITGAYPFFMSNLPDTDKCIVKYSDQWLKADWGIIKATVDITADYTPIVFDTEDGKHILPLGKRTDIFTTEELRWVHNHQAGKIEFIDGYFFKWLSDRTPYRDAVKKLFLIRQSNDGMVANLARRMAQGISGKLDQDNTDGSLGEFYNPISAAMTRSRCRLAVGDFIWDNALQDNVIAVQVDGVLADRQVEVSSNRDIGSWRLEETTPALVLGKGEIWKPDKKPLFLSMSEVVEAMKAHPQRSNYDFEKNTINLIEMESEPDRVYDHFPKNGKQALNSISESKPISIKGA